MATKTYSYTYRYLFLRHPVDDQHSCLPCLKLAISSYSANLGLLMLLKCEGKSLVEEAGEAAVKRLVENR